MPPLKQIIERNDTPQGKWFDLFIQVLIIFSIVVFSLETLPGLSRRTTDVLKWCEVFCVLLFTLEYAMRIYVADRKRNFIFSVFGIIDLLSILPFYLNATFDLRSLRALRLLRLFRLFKLVRYNRAIRRIHLAFLLIKEELILFLFIAMLIVYFSAVGIYYFENEAQPDVFSSVPQSLWWATTTLTTVGYGDTYPITAAGKLFTFLVLVVGLGTVAVPSGLFASALTKAHELEPETPAEIEQSLSDVRQEDRQF